MSLIEKRKKHKVVKSKEKRVKSDKSKTHQKIRKILQKKKREKEFKKAYPIEKPKGDLTLSASECALKLTGLPYDVTEEQIREWFENDGIKIEEVHICGKERKCGIAYVIMKKEKGLRLGLAKSKQHLGGRYIIVELKRRQEMAEVMQLAGMLDNAVCLRGLPYTVYRLDILRFFSGMNIAPRGIHLRNKGFGIVEFTDHQTALEALKKNDEYIRDRYVKVFPCRMKDLVQMRDQIFAEKKKPVVESEKTDKTSENMEEETKDEEMESKSVEKEGEVEESTGAKEDVEDESSGEENKENGMEVDEEDHKEEEEKDADKTSAEDVKEEESDKEETPEEDEKPKKGKGKTVKKVIDDKFSPRRLRSRTGTPVKTTPAKRLGRKSTGKAKK